MKIKRLCKNLISVFVSLCWLLFYRIQLYDASNIKNYTQCAVLWNKYKHTQKSVVNWNGYSAYRSFLYISEKKFVIPGLSEGFVPQGITFCEKLNSFMISGYSSRGGAAYIITVDAKSGRLNGEYEIQKSDGSSFFGHSGGIASYGKYIYITDGYSLYYTLTSGFKSGSSAVRLLGEIMLPSAASFVTCYDGYLWAGNFYHKSLGKKYDASSADKYGTQYRTLIVGYRLDAKSAGGIKKNGVSEIAEAYLALYAPNEVQGAAFLENGDIHLSCSYGRQIMSSQLLYGCPFGGECDLSVNIDGKNIPVWFLNNDRLKRSVNTLPMSEGAVSRDGKVYIIFESASEKYMDTSLDPTDSVWEMKWK